MSALGSLVVSLALEYAQYNSALDKSEKAALDHAKRVQDTFDGIKGSLMGTATAVAGGLAAAFTIGAFKNLIADTVASGAALNDLAIATGASVEGLSALAAVGKYSDMALEQIGASMNVLTRNLAGATEESKGAGAALDALGLSLDDFRQLKPEDQMQAVARALDGFQDGAGKSAVMMALFGKEGAKMLPFMRDLASVGELQARVTTEQAAAADQLDDNWLKLTSTGGAVAEEVAMGMVPALDQSVRAMMDVLGAGGGVRETLRGLVADGSIERWTRSAVIGLSYVVDVAEYIWRQFEVVGKAAGGVLAGVVLAVQGDFKGAMSALNASGQDMVDTFTAPTLGQKFRESMDKVRVAAKDTAGDLDKPKLAFVNLASSGKKAADEMDKAAQRGKELAAGLTAQASGLSGDFTKKWADLSAAYASGAISLEQLVAAQAKLLEQQPFMVEQAKDLKEAQDKASESMAKWADQRLNETKALTDQIQTRQDEIAALGLSAEATAQLSAAKLEQAAAEKEAYAAALQAASFYAGEYRDAYSQAAADALEQAAALRQLAGLELEKGTRQAAVEARDEWKKSVEKIDDIFRQGFADMINSGKSGWDSFTKSLTTTFKTEVADQIYKMLAQPFVVRLVAAITGVGGASAAGATGLTGSGGGSGLSVGQLSNAYSTGSSLYTLGSQVWNGTMSMANAGGTYLANATGTGLDGLLATNGAYGTAAGATGGMASYLPGIGGALGAFGFGQKYGVAGGVLGGIGSTALAGGIGGLAAGTGFGAGAMGALGALGPWGWAAIGAGALLGGLFGKDDPTYKFTTNSSQAPTKKVFEDGVYVQSVYGNIGMADHYSNGIKADKYKDTFQSIANLDAGIAAGLTAAQNAAIKKALDGYTGGKMGTVEAYVQGRLQIITNTLGGAIDALADQFKGTTEQFAGYVTQLVQVQALIPSITFLNKALDGTSTAATQTAMALATAFGGVSGANSVMGSFVQNYYTDAEKLTMQTASLAEVFQAAGLTMPHTTQEFRSLVEAQDLTTDAGRQSYVALMAVSGAFYDLTQQAKSAAGALGADFFSTAADYQYYQTTGQVPARVPAFAAGGMHGGGWAVVGEQGPELVNLSPARVYSNSDSKGLLDTSGLARELAALRADARINAATLVDVLKRVDKLFNRWDMNGMPETRSVAV